MKNDDSPKQINPDAIQKPKQVMRWRCPNCGQTLFTAPDFEPPDICAYCRDMTTWELIDIAQTD